MVRRHKFYKGTVVTLTDAFSRSVNTAAAKGFLRTIL
jgi:hypothetical protein